MAVKDGQEEGLDLFSVSVDGVIRNVGGEVAAVEVYGAELSDLSEGVLHGASEGVPVKVQLDE